MAEVHVSAVIEAPLEDTWRIVRDFNGLPKWLPGIKGSEIEGGGPADAIGAVRVMDVGMPDMKVREKLLALSDGEHSMTYSVLQGPLPLDDLVATIRMTPGPDDGTTLVEWSAEFTPRPASEEKAQKLLTKVFDGGLAALRDTVAG